MKSQLQIAQSKNTPLVEGDASLGEVKIEGNSFPENAQKFYANILDWIEPLEFSKGVKITCDFNYMASSSLICMLEVLRKFEAKLGSEKCELNWKFEDDDDDIKKIGQNFGKILKMKINLMPY